jgi:hypothetical protein
MVDTGSGGEETWSVEGAEAAAAEWGRLIALRRRRGREELAPAITGDGARA